MHAKATIFNAMLLHYAMVVETNFTYEPNCSTNENNGKVEELSEEANMTPSVHSHEVLHLIHLKGTMHTQYNNTMKFYVCMMPDNTISKHRQQQKSDPFS